MRLTLVTQYAPNQLPALFELANNKVTRDFIEHTMPLKNAVKNSVVNPKNQAACTPDFYIFDKDLFCVYRGQFDDARPTLLL